MKESNRRARTRSWSDDSEAGKTSNTKKSRPSQNDRQTLIEQTQENKWKVIIQVDQDGGHYHPIKLTRAIEEEIGRIKYARFMNTCNQQTTTGKDTRNVVTKGERMKAHIPGEMVERSNFRSPTEYVYGRC